MKEFEVKSLTSIKIGQKQLPFIPEDTVVIHCSKKNYELMKNFPEYAKASFVIVKYLRWVKVKFI